MGRQAANAGRMGTGRRRCARSEWLVVSKSRTGFATLTTNYLPLNTPSGPGGDEELFDLSVGLGVSADGDGGAAGVRDVVGRAGHAAALVGVAARDAGDGAQRGEGGFEVGESVGVEVVVGVCCEERAVDLPLLETGEDDLEGGSKGIRRGSCGSCGGKQFARDAVADGGGCAGCNLVGEHDDGNAVVGEDDVL